MRTVVLGAVLVSCLANLCLGAHEPKEKPKEKEKSKEKSEPVSLVKIVNRAKETEFKLMGAEEYKALDNELRMELKLRSKAIQLAAKEWKQDKELAKKQFPESCIGPMKIMVLGTYTDQDKADKKLSELEDRVDGKKDRGENRGKAGAAKMEREDTRSIEREELCNKAREMYESKLAELIKPAEKAEEGAKGGEEKAPEEKQPAKGDKPLEKGDKEKAK